MTKRQLYIDTKKVDSAQRQAERQQLIAALDRCYATEQVPDAIINGYIGALADNASDHAEILARIIYASTSEITAHRVRHILGELMASNSLAAQIAEPLLHTLGFDPIPQAGDSLS